MLAKPILRGESGVNLLPDKNTKKCNKLKSRLLEESIYPGSQLVINPCQFFLKNVPLYLSLT